MKVGYYPGCSLESTARPYDCSTRQSSRLLDYEIEEVSGWSCCGSSPALKMDRLLSLSLSAHNLALLEKNKTREVLVPCPFCYRRLLSAREEIGRDKDLKARVEAAIEIGLKEQPRIYNLLEFVRDKVGLKAVEAKVKKPLKGLKLIPYYGCYLVKPPAVTRFDDCENPTSMDEILEALGAEVLDWDFKTECCGSGLSLSKTEKVVELGGRLVREALWRGADAMVVVCQLCHANLDMRQGEMSRMYGKKLRLPILYLPQVMGLAFGLSPETLGFNHHLASVDRLISRIGDF